MKKTRNGFTLVEILIVVCIIGIIAAVALGGCSDAVSSGALHHSNY